MKQIIFLVLLGIAAAVLTGCASNSGTADFPGPEKLRQIQLNKSTKEEIRKMMGEPQSVTLHSNRTESWRYEKTHTAYTEKYAAKTALSFVPIPHLGTAVGLADRVADTGPDKIRETRSLTLLFDKKGILREIKKETKRN